MIRAVLLIFAGSGLGGVMRYLMQLAISKRLPSIFPFGTFSVNVLGCFLIGVFYALGEKENVLSPEARLFLITGICGGYTTFSSFSLDNMTLLRSGNYGYFFLYTAGSVVMGLLATYLGIQSFKSA